MKTITASRFKADCLKIMDEVKVGREPVLITKKGKAVAQLMPVEDRALEVFGCLSGELEIAGDITPAMSPPSRWKGSQ